MSIYMYNTSSKDALDSRIKPRISPNMLLFCLLKILIKIIAGYQGFFSHFIDLLIVSHLLLQKVQEQNNV